MSKYLSHSDHLTAADIEAYLNVELSEQEMHLIERHLLECDLCNEAMEGYESQLTSIDIAENVKELNKKIDKRINQNKKKRVFPFIRIAAIAIALIVSAIFITNYFVSDIKNPEFSEKKDVVKGEEEVEVSEEVDGAEELEEEEVKEEVKGEVKGEVKREVKGEVNEEVKGEVKREVSGEVKEEVKDGLEELEGVDADNEFDLSDTDIKYANSTSEGNSNTLSSIEESNYTQSDNSIQIVENDAAISVFSDEVESSYGKIASPSEDIIIVSSKADKANNNSGRLKGSIIDNESKEFIPFALIVVKSEDEVIAETNTDFDGKYDLRDLASAEYDIEVSSVGFTKKIIMDVVVNANKITFQDVELDSGYDLNTIEVVAYSVPLIDKDGGSSGGTVTSEDIVKMPMRDASSSPSTVTGVQSSSKKRSKMKKSKKRYSHARFGEGDVTNEDSYDAYPNIGLDAFNTYLLDSLDYPIEAKENNISGIVIIKVTVASNGELADYKVVKSLGYGCDAEAIRLIKQGPQWIGASKKGKPISSTVKVEVNFE